MRPLTGGRQDLPYIHSLNLGLLFRDPPQPSSAETAAENSSLERASIGIRKAYEGEAECVLNMERLKMKKVHEALHFQGHHIGRTSMLTGMREEYYITDLNSDYKQDFIFRTVSKRDTDKHVSNTWLVSKKINLFLDRFLSLISSKIPLVDQRDLLEQNFRLLSAGTELQRPEKFILPSIYIANMLYPSDVRINPSGDPYICRSWKPANDLSTPWDIFPLFSIIRASNPEKHQEPPVLANLMRQDSPHHPQQSRCGDSVASPGPSTSRDSSQVRVPKQSSSGLKRKARRRPSNLAKACKSNSEIINVSPVDKVEPPELVITLGDSEYEEFKSDSDSDSESPSESPSTPSAIVTSPEYDPSPRLLATSDCSTVLLDELKSPEYDKNQLSTPIHIIDYRPNPLSSQRWSDSE